MVLHEGIKIVEVDLSGSFKPRRMLLHAVRGMPTRKDFDLIRNKQALLGVVFFHSVCEGHSGKSFVTTSKFLDRALKTYMAQFKGRCNDMDTRITFMCINAMSERGGSEGRFDIERQILEQIEKPYPEISINFPSPLKGVSCAAKQGRSGKFKTPVNTLKFTMDE